MCICYTGCVQNMILQLLFIVEILENIKDRKCFLDCNMGCPSMTITISFKIPLLSQVKYHFQRFNEPGFEQVEPGYEPYLSHLY